MKRKYSTIEAIFHNSLVKHLPSLDLKINGVACSLRYLPDSPVFKPSITLKIGLLQEFAMIDFSDLSFLSLHNDTKNVNNYELLPEELQNALAQYIFDDILKKFARVLNTPLTFLTNTDEMSNKVAGKLFSFSFLFSYENKQIPLVFHLSQACIEQILPRLTALPSEKTDFSQTIVPCSVEVGSIELTINELRDLDKGDVLLVDTLSHLGEEKSALFYPLSHNEYNQLPSFYCTIEKNKLILSQTYRLTQDISMSEEIVEQVEQVQENAQEAQGQEVQAQAAHAQVSQEPANFGDMKVKVSFELERRTMTIAELENLAIGTNLLLDSDPKQPVTLVVSDTAFAKARIVEIEGKYGLQLTEIMVNKD